MIFESFDENAYLNRDFDFPRDMSHSEKHLEMTGEMKRISDIVKKLVENGTLKVGCDFVKDILPKLGSGKILFQFLIKKLVLSEHRWGVNT